VSGYGVHGFSFLHLAVRSERPAGQPAACAKYLVSKLGMAVDTSARSASTAWLEFRPTTHQILVLRQARACACKLAHPCTHTCMKIRTVL